MAAARGRGVQADLPHHAARFAELERGDVAGEVERIGAGRREEVAAGEGQGADVGAVLLPSIWNAGRDERPVAVRVDGHVCRGVNEVLADPVPRLHQRIEVIPGRMHGDPARMIARVGTFDRADEVQLSRRLLVVDPELVRLEVGGVEIFLRGVKDHAVDAGIRLVLVVLHIVFKLAGGRDSEDGAVACVVVEGVAVDGVGGFLGGEEEDGAGVGFGRGGLCYSVLVLHVEIDDGILGVRSWSMGWEVWWTIDVGESTAKLDHFFMAAPYMFFLACYYCKSLEIVSVDVPSVTYIESHPRDGLILGYRGALDKLQSQLLVVKGKSEDGARRRPGADHEVVDRHLDWVV